MNPPPNPVLMGADLAAHCKKNRVDQAPVVLPDRHPLRVAEDVALLDNMTQGRVDFGAGRGLNESAWIQRTIVRFCRAMSAAAQVAVVSTHVIATIDERIAS